jgi:ABC-type transport system involved in multi-copper enzyme maturation permease subunit
MIKYIILNDIRQNILSLRLQVTFLIMIAVFVAGSVAYVFQYRSAAEEFRIYVDKSKNGIAGMEYELISQPKGNITSEAVEMRNYVFSPSRNGFIEDAKSQYIPNTITYNAFNVFGYSISRNSGNPYLNLSQDLNWSFIITMILSFAILLLSFDMISGEREKHTLTLVLSNGVSRSVLLFGKYISIVVTAFLIILPGFMISLIILIASGILSLNTTVLYEALGFIAVHLLFTSCLAALGIFCSVISRSSNLSLLITLTLWSVFLIFSPNLAVFSAESLFKIKDSETIQAEIESAKEAINNAAPEGSWSMNGNNPFYPKHELRANNQTNLMNAEKKIRDAWYNEQFAQYKRASYVTYLSPMSLFGIVSESIAGVGFSRFMKNWEDIHEFQPQFLAWFKGIDRKDPKSPHWYNPFEVCSTSLEKVNNADIPQYEERTMTLAQRLSAALPGMMLLMIYSVVLFGVTVALFNRYDVR